ncbi:MAG: hypothetical protein ACK559_27590, partial [bacterium]
MEVSTAAAIPHHTSPRCGRGVASSMPSSRSTPAIPLERERARESTSNSRECRSCFGCGRC